MSLSYEKIKPILVRDPRTILENDREYAVLKGGQDNQYKQWTTNSISSSSAAFNCPPSANNVIVDPKVYFELPIRLTFVGTAPVGEVLLNPNQDAPRAYPISNITQSLKVAINGTAVTVPLSDVNQALLHFNTDERLSNLDFSMTPNLLDQSQAYSDLYLSSRNPLGFYGDSGNQQMQGRGGFPFKIVSNTNTSAVVDMIVCEPIFLSPFYWGKSNSSGLYNVTNMDFNFIFLANAGFRLWSHDAVSNGVQTTITSISAQFNQFTGTPFSFTNDQAHLYINYITPQETQLIPFNKPLTYPYFQIDRYNQDAGGAIGAGVTTTLTSQTISVGTIPRRMYVYVRERNADLESTADNPDTYFSIENFTMQFQNKPNLFAEASKKQLYEMSVKNHCNMSWTEWSGGPVYKVGDFSNQIGTIGSIICVEFATDIGLSSLDAPGKDGKYTIQCKVVCKNISNRSIFPSLYLVPISEGTFTIPKLGAALSQTGVISSKDILYAEQNPSVNYRDVEEVNGGNFMSGLRQFGNDVWNGIKKVSAFAKNDLLPVAKTVGEVLPLFGLGEDEEIMEMENRGNGGVLVGGVAVGGRTLSREELKKRINKMKKR